MNARRLWLLFKRVWITVGISATVVLAVWSFLAFRATADAWAAISGDDVVTVTHAGTVWRFSPTKSDTTPRAGMLFFPGALVDPIAYAPLARAVAAAGYPVRIVELPRRGALGGGNDPLVLERALSVMHAEHDVRWVVAGHSKGAVVASAFAAAHPRELSGLVLIGSTHPRDVDLSSLLVPVMKIVGTRDRIATIAGSETNRHLLPAGTRWVRIEGGNHSQFGWYGFQPGDGFAGISRDAQHALLIAAVLDQMRLTDGK